MFKFDTHVHTSETSSCGMLCGKETAALYHRAGYGGICVTDHYTRHFFESRQGTWDDLVSRYLAGYREALAEGDRLGLTVLLGMELLLDGFREEYLIFGVTEGFLRRNPGLYSLPLPAFYQIARENGLLVYQAHPFRSGMTPADPAFLDGMEVYNGNPRHNSQNHLALAYAKEHGLGMSAGSDCHQLEDVEQSGIAAARPVKTNGDFLKTLTERTYTLLPANAFV